MIYLLIGGTPNSAPNQEDNVRGRRGGGGCTLINKTNIETRILRRTFRCWRWRVPYPLCKTRAWFNRTLSKFLLLPTSRKLGKRTLTSKITYIQWSTKKAYLSFFFFFYSIRVHSSSNMLKPHRAKCHSTAEK